MSTWGSAKAARVLATLERIGWHVKRQSGSRCTLGREGCDDYVWAFHDDVEIGPNLLARVAKKTGLKPSDL
jgi:predicted RNA binding protein YcfA (HicA-like mRNA interferase family)